MMGSCWAGHWIDRQMRADEMQLKLWVGRKWSQKRQNGVAAAVPYKVKDVGYLKTYMFERHSQVEGIGFRF